MQSFEVVDIRESPEGDNYNFVNCLRMKKKIITKLYEISVVRICKKNYTYMYIFNII